MFAMGDGATDNKIGKNEITNFHRNKVHYYNNLINKSNYENNFDP